MTNSGTVDQARAALAAFEEGNKTLAELETVLAAALQSGLLTPAVAMEVLGKPVAAGVVPADALMRLGLGDASDGTALRSPETPLKSSMSAEGQPAPGNSQSNKSVSARLDSIATGQLLAGRYRLERKLGEGGMGVVYLASDQEVKGETFAIKVLTPEIRERPDALELLREEVRKTRALAHPNIVGVYSLNVDRTDVFILMECLEGKTLQALLDEDFGRGMPFDRAWPIISDVGAALAYAHDHSVIHGDLKPANVFVTTSGKAKLLDFGIARAARGPRRAKDAAVLSALTPAYASCEMLEGVAPDPRDDIYAFACMIYEMLSGRHPFGGRSAVEARDAGEKPVPIERLTGRQNSALTKALSFDRAARTATVEALLAGIAPGAGSGKRRVVFSTGTWVAALLVASAVTLAYFVVDKFWLSKHVAPAAPAAAVSQKSVAVLPFVDMSEKKDEEYFADGTAEEILDLLARVPGLHVPARTSSFYFKGKSEDIPTIARRLLVANVLEGSVRKSGNRVRITVQLVRADNGYHLWSETYDRQLDDIFKVQDEIAGEVVKALKISLGANELPRAVATQNAEAHALLLQANYFFDRETPGDLTKAIGYFQQAIRSDPDSAAAWAGLSLVLTLTWANGWVPNDRTVQQQRTQALQAAERAIAIDPRLGVAHEALAEVRYWFDWDWAGVEAEIAKGRALDPASTWIAGSLASLRGHLNDALRLWEQATERDPLNHGAYLYRAVIYYAMGQFTEALAAARKAVELSPTSSRSHAVLAQMLLAVGQRDAALAEAEKESDAGFRAHARARTYILVGRRADADATLAEFEKSFAADWAYEIAVLHALRGETDQAFLWLDRAYEQRNAGLIGTPSINIDPDLKSLRGDPRFKAFLRKMKLPE
jgi:TolB-like protein/Flp pilus assembly protein TadD